MRQSFRQVLSGRTLFRFFGLNLWDFNVQFQQKFNRESWTTKATPKYGALTRDRGLRYKPMSETYLEKSFRKNMPNQAELSLSQIGQIALNAHDLERAVNFYRDRLGMKHVFSVPPKMSFFDCNGITLMLSLPEKPEFDHPGSIIYFDVEDIDAAARTLTERGVVFEQQPAFVANMGSHDLWMAFFRDSENNVLALRSNVPHKAQQSGIPEV